MLYGTKRSTRFNQRCSKVDGYYRLRKGVGFVLLVHILPRAGGWDHLICHTCPELNREVFRRRKDFKHSTTEEGRKDSEKALKDAESQIFVNLVTPTESRLG